MLALSDRASHARRLATDEDNAGALTPVSRIGRAHVWSLRWRRSFTVSRLPAWGQAMDESQRDQTARLDARLILSGSVP
jgi:hypothetical protein